MLGDSAGAPEVFLDSIFPDHYRASEIPAAEEVSMDPRPTPEAFAIVPEIPASERAEGKQAPPPVIAGADERVEALLAELLTQLKERKALEEVAAMRWTRCSELLEEVRFARRLLRELTDPDTTEDNREKVYDQLNEWLAKPI